MLLTLWTIAFLSLSLPADYQLVDSSTETVQRDLFKADHESRTWRSADGKTLNLFYWQPMPVYDGGPVNPDHYVNQWPITIAGQKTKIIEDTMHGFKIHLQFSHPPATATLHAQGYSHDEFQTLLRKAGIRHAQRP